MSLLTLNKVSFYYPNGHLAVDRVSLSFARGEAVAIIGQNGAGKTTTVKLMNGLLKPSNGDVIVDGWNTKEYTTAQLSKKVGYVFQNPDEQIFHHDIESEIAFGPQNLGLRDDQIDQRVKEAAALTGLESYLQENPYNLPYAMRKFVTMASVIAMDPDVIIFDEPTAGQDQKALQRLAHLIQTLKQKNKTVITITHDIEFVVQSFQRVIVMAQKKVIADGNQRQILWDFDVLQQAALHQPYISRVYRALKIGDQKILDIPELVAELEQMRSDKQTTPARWTGETEE